MNEDIIRRLEEKIAHLEHHVTEQDKVMLEFSEDLTRLRRELKLLVARVANAGPSATLGEEAGEERPPHY